MNAPTPAQLNAAATTRKDGDTTIVEIGGVDVHVRVRDDGALYVWVEMDDADAPLLDPESECLPVKMGVGGYTVYEADRTGREASTDLECTGPTPEEEAERVLSGSWGEFEASTEAGNPFAQQAHALRSAGLLRNSGDRLCLETTDHGNLVLICDLPKGHPDDVHQQSGVGTWTRDGNVL